VASELEYSLEKKKETYKQLKKQIKKLDEHSENLKVELEECEDELDQTQMLLQQKLLIIEQLEKETGEKAVDIQIEKPRAARGNYRAVHGDLTDELLARIINELNVQMPIARICEGWYLFGTKKINTKVMNGNTLLVRVGGGYCNLKEFIETYQQNELTKIADLELKGEWDFPKLLQYYKNI